MMVTASVDETGGDATRQLSSIAKAARVLRALALSDEGDAGVSNLAAFAELPKSTTHRVLVELIREGLVARNQQQKYRLGKSWFELQAALSCSEWVRLVEQAKAPLASLFERTGATVHFGVLSDEKIMYLEKLTARGGTSVPTRVGAQMPATCTALGKALLAYSDREVIQSVLSKPLPVVSGRSVAQPRLLLSQLVQARKTGLSFDVEECQLGVFCVATPVFRNGRAVAAVSLTRVGSGGLTAADPVEVRRAAGEISKWISTTG
ncbi:IclR family transcriptional regulator [Amycolatopsis methanolica]|uniref:Transcriptional regulator, IclR family n=1 Tax=Amycolatopsis methanolica 239 TaxID=1068978 RepID=A0A076MTZ8_AMYME|nr:IclR family transcriptional regulator [Amycolatopsis methanolica]AIJ21277.1 transcriptional regulator, IclR family [Amycolatopsis methanolica 239]